MSAKVTIRDVAREAGCSPSLVSLYLRTPQTTRIAHETKKRIAHAVEKLNYRRNLLASILKSGSSNMIGVLADAQANGTIFRLIAALEAEAAERHVRLQIGLFHDSLENLLEACSLLKQYGAAGIICLCHDYPAFNRELEEHFMAEPGIVFYDGPLREGHSCVIPDKKYSVELAFNCLKQRGRKRIGLCIPGNCPEWYSVSCKLQAFTQLAGDELVCRLPHQLDLRQAARDFLLPFVREKSPDALLFANDRHALCASLVLMSAGIRVPEDVALIGFDNDPICGEHTPALSCLALDQKQIAGKLFDLVLKPHRSPEVITLRPELRLRESC